MFDQVWISEVMSNNELGDRVGLRQKYFGEPWRAPYEKHVVPNIREKATAAVFRQYGGHTVMREDMPEASAVYDMSRFKRMKDVFFIGGFLAVKGRVAEVLRPSISARAAASSPTPSMKRTKQRRCVARSTSLIWGQ